MVFTHGLCVSVGEVRQPSKFFLFAFSHEGLAEYRGRDSECLLRICNLAVFLFVCIAVLCSANCHYNFRFTKSRLVATEGPKTDLT